MHSFTKKGLCYTDIKLEHKVGTHLRFKNIFGEIGKNLGILLR